MKTEEKKECETKTEDNEYGCCQPENFEKMFEMMGQCCSGKSKSNDFAAMMKNMMEMCSKSKTGNVRSDCTTC